jgi:uncharacterized membrane protein
MAELTNTTARLNARIQTVKTSSHRLLAIDIVRGYAMLLMLISHSSWWLDDLDYGVAYGWDNMIVPDVSFPGSLPGFVLQLATPAFFLLGGFGIALFAVSRKRRGWDEWHISRFLLIRGVLLIALDLTIMNLRLSAPYYHEGTSVLTGMGICVCLMAGLRRLDWRVLAGIMLLALLGTQLYYHTLTAAGEWPREESLLRAVLLAPSVEDITWKTQFPALAWLPVVLLGFIAGSRVAAGRAALGNLALRLGLACLILFMLGMIAGDIGSIYPADPFIFGKHPPDLGYISLYTGITCLLIALHSMIDAINHAAALKFVIVLGQTALFFYLIHLRLIELISPLFASLPLHPLERSGLIVLAALPLLVLLCVWYQAHKRQHPDSLLKYF